MSMVYNIENLVVIVYFFSLWLLHSPKGGAGRGLYSDSGIVIVNLVPLPSSLLALMVPWCSSTIFCT